ncbi:unnamed protein product [Trichobilharzia szidati]|nr:unnamed protein product [Trichobilharzia szidati]
MSKAAKQHWRRRGNPSFYMITNEDDDSQLKLSKVGEDKTLSQSFNMLNEASKEDKKMSVQNSEYDLKNTGELTQSESKTSIDQSKSLKQLQHSHTTSPITNQIEGSERKISSSIKLSNSSDQICISDNNKNNNSSCFNDYPLKNTSLELPINDNNNEQYDVNRSDQDVITANKPLQQSQKKWDSSRNFISHTPNRVHFNFSKSIDVDDDNHTLLRGLFNRAFRPNLRRAVSEVKDVYNPEDTEISIAGNTQQRHNHHTHRNQAQNKPHRHTHQQNPHPRQQFKSPLQSASHSHQHSSTQLHAYNVANQPYQQPYRLNEFTNRLEQVYNSPRQFDSSILEIPVDIYGDVVDDVYPRINWPSCDFTRMDSEHSLHSTRIHESLTNETNKERDLLLGRNAMMTNEANTTPNFALKRANRLNAMRRMNTTAVEQHYPFGNAERSDTKKQIKQESSHLISENYPYTNNRCTQNTLNQDNLNTTLNKVSDSFEYPSDSVHSPPTQKTSLYRSSSSGTRNLECKIDLDSERPYSIDRIVSDSNGNPPVMSADKCTLTSNANISQTGVVNCNNITNVQNNSAGTTTTTTAMTAIANGNLTEPIIDPLKQSTSSYLKEQFQAFFQPSDNKLAMKLFGSKNALLKEKRRQVQQGKWVIHPCSNFRFYWDLLMLMLLIANLIILPVAISFFNDDLSIHWIIFNSISDVVFIADIAVKFRTGVVTNDYADEIILNPKEIARHYVKSWFVLDFISSIPMDYIYLIFNKKDHYNQFFSAGRTLRILRLAKLLSMLRLLRLTRLVRYVSQWEEFLNIASKFMGIFNLVLLMLLLGHWNACLQYLIPMLMEFPPDSWVKRCKLENADWFQQYTWALFKAMSHMLSIGYGRFPPTSIGEAWITIVSMMSGATCYALFVGHAAALIQSFDTSKRLYREKFKQVEEYMAYRKLPRALRQRIANYYEHRYQGKMFDEAQILNEFSECLREQVINYNCRALVAAVPFFTYADQDFVSEVVTKLKFEVFQPGDLIIKEGTIGNKMYFIQEGIVDIITKDGEVATSLSDGSYFGEITLLTNARRVASVKAVVYSNLYSLDRESFLSVLENYPLMRRTMESVAAERLNKIGQNPAIVSNREDLKEDLSLVKEIVSSAVTPEDSSSGPETENEDNQAHLNFKHLLKFRKRKQSNRHKLFDNCITKLSQANEEDEALQTQDSSDLTSPDKLKLPKFMRQKRNSSNLFLNPAQNLLNITKHQHDKSKTIQNNSNEDNSNNNDNKSPKVDLILPSSSSSQCYDNFISNISNSQSDNLTPTTVNLVTQNISKANSNKNKSDTDISRKSTE